MILCEKHLIKRGCEEFKEIDELSLKSKNLYNTSLYEVRQHYFKEKKYLTGYSLIKKFTKEKKEEYLSLPRKVSQQVILDVDKNFRGFFGALKSPKMKGKKIRIPKYKEKDGRGKLTYTSQAISKKYLKNGFVNPSGTKLMIKTQRDDIREVSIIPRGDSFCVNILYYVEEPKILDDNGNYASIDIGVNNLATVAFNKTRSFIINGRPLKSINQFFNKKRAKLQNKTKNKKKIQKLCRKRNNKIKDYLHKASHYLVNQLVSKNVSKIIIGHNKGWKQDINIGKRNNQNFVSIPFNDFISMVKYKAKLKAIETIETEESYTSKCSFLDNESVEKHENYLGKRIKRGLFKSSSGKLINADLNASLNILKKVVGNFCYPIEVCSTPSVHSVNFN